MVDFPSNGHTCAGYLATPSSGPGPGIVVIQEWWGLVPQIKEVCDRIAGEGFTALAPDLYHGDEISLKEPDEAGKRMMAMRIDEAGRDMSGAAGWLLQSGGATGSAVGVVGFCMGGGLAIILASLRPEVKAVSAFYPVIPWEDAKPDLSKIKAKIIAHFGGKDSYNTPYAIADLERRMSEAGVSMESHHYADCDHGFFNDDRPEAYNEHGAQLSWDRTMALFRTELAG